MMNVNKRRLTYNKKKIKKMIETQLINKKIDKFKLKNLL